MRPSLKVLLVCGSLVVLTFTADSQTPAAPSLTVHCSGPTPPTPPLPLRIAPVTGAPYSGEEESYSNPPDALLNQLPPNVARTVVMQAGPREVTHVYRDSAGRVRRETSMCPGSSPDNSVTIDIRDPVAGVQYILDPQSHVARRSTLTVVSANPANTDGSIPPNLRGMRRSEQLGTQTVEGLLTTGTKVTSTSPRDPRNSQGSNTEEVCENWISSDLHVLVLRKCLTTGAPVAMGEYGVRLTHVSRDEPDPSLFQLPTGYKVVDRAVLGVYVQELSPTIARQFGLDAFQGVLVGDVPSNTPAFNAGLKRGDVILKVDNEPMHTPIQFTSKVSQMMPGATITLETWRDGKTQDVSVTLGGGS